MLNSVFGWASSSYTTIRAAVMMAADDVNERSDLLEVRLRRPPGPSKAEPMLAELSWTGRVILHEVETPARA